MPGKILIVDDDADFVEAMTTLLQAKGYQAISADSGQEGFKKAKNESPQIMLLDVVMAHQSEGFHIARSMKEDEATKDIPVVMITGIRQEMKLPFGFEPDPDWLPVKAILEKPVKPEVLLKIIEENIRK